jgi:hypothetical protein
MLERLSGQVVSAKLKVTRTFSGALGPAPRFLRGRDTGPPGFSPDTIPAGFFFAVFQSGCVPPTEAIRISEAKKTHASRI